MVLTKVWRSRWGCGLAIGTPAPADRRRRRRVAVWRSIRAPRLLSRIGPPARSLIAWSMALPTAGGSGIRTTLVPLPHTRSTPVAVLFAEVGDVRAGGLEDPQAEQP